jgi:hypothetical protein
MKLLPCTKSEMFNDRQCFYYVYALVSNEFLTHLFVRRQYDDIEERHAERRYDLARSSVVMSQYLKYSLMLTRIFFFYLSVEQQSHVQARLCRKTHLQQ